MDADDEVSESVGCRNIAVYANANANYALPLKNANKTSQLLVVVAESPVNEVTRSCETARCDTEELFRVAPGVKQVLWIPAED